jgi:hypothetical protein
MQTVSSSFLVIISMSLSGPGVGGLPNCQVVSVQGWFHKGDGGKAAGHVVPEICLLLLRTHKTLRVTPAMEAGDADHVWTLEEI